MRGHAVRLALVPILVLSAEVGVIAQRATTAAEHPPAASASKPAAPAAKSPVAAAAPASQLKGALDRIQQRVAATVGPAAIPQIAPNFPALAKGPTPSGGAARTPPVAAPATKAPAPTAAATPPAASPVPVAKPAGAPARAAAPGPARIQLNWRATLAWPKTLVNTAGPVPVASSRITLVWR